MTMIMMMVNHDIADDDDDDDDDDGETQARIGLNVIKLSYRILLDFIPYFPLLRYSPFALLALLLFLSYSIEKRERTGPRWNANVRVCNAMFCKTLLRVQFYIYFYYYYHYYVPNNNMIRSQSRHSRRCRHRPTF